VNVPDLRLDQNLQIGIKRAPKVVFFIFFADISNKDFSELEKQSPASRYFATQKRVSND
jgi:hypothetical protein